MVIQCLVKQGEYYDSVRLMLAARELAGRPGIKDAAVVMGTEANKAILREAGLLNEAGQAAGANDLVIAILAEDAQSAAASLNEAEQILKKKSPEAENDLEGRARPKSLRSAIKGNPQANMAVISVAGRYAAGEAWEALHHGLNVLLFSDNVSLEDEIALKQYACQAGLLMMGPGAGTAIINGIGLGFANKVPEGPVGIVSAAGTGLQEVSCLLAKYGTGISQGLGVGGRDLKKEVGGLMMLECIKALQEDPATQTILLISKPAAAEVTQVILEQVSSGGKPTIACFIGGDKKAAGNYRNVRLASTLQEAALLGAVAVQPVQSGAGLKYLKDFYEKERRALEAQAREARSHFKPEQRYLRGLFSGGTLCYEAQSIWRDMLDEPVLSNAPLEEKDLIGDATTSRGHTAIDLGEEEFTVGRPHPMIDHDLRIRRLYQEASDPQVAVILLDVVLGYGAHPDPASELAPAIIEARRQAAEDESELSLVASITGTQADPQDYARQAEALREAGVSVCESNAEAARLCALLVNNY